MELVKAHAYGNDFLLLPSESTEPSGDMASLARRVCDRHAGIGADGLMIVVQTEGGARTRLLNADGSRSEISGNGIRCVAAWLARTRGLAAGAQVVLDTEAGLRTIDVLSVDGTRYFCRAEMGQPEGLRQVPIEVAGQTVTAVVLRVGNPQCVVIGPPEGLTTNRLHTIGAGLAVHPFFPEGTNVELATVVEPGRVKVLIWERGVGPTEASGTGACAAAVATAMFGGAARVSDVVSPGGTQRVEWTGDGLFLTGWAELTGAVQWWGAR